MSANAASLPATYVVLAVESGADPLLPAHHADAVDLLESSPTLVENGR